MRIAMRQASTLYYLLPDLLGSATVALTSTGSFQAVQLFSPYGPSRYSSGSMPTDYNFTGQRLDSETGLIYENFRYYDPLSGRFTRADTVDTNAKGLDGYGYVGDNPETKGDPTGHDWNWGAIITVVAIVAVVAVVAVVAAPVVIAAAGAAAEVAATSVAAEGVVAGTTAVAEATAATAAEATAAGTVEAATATEATATAIAETTATETTATETTIAEATAETTTNTSTITSSVNSSSSSNITSTGERFIQGLIDRGVTVIRDDPEVNAYLRSQDANGVTWFNGLPGDAGPQTTTVLLGENANDATVYEEWLHVQAAMQRGWLGLGDQEALAEELMVKQQLLENSDWLNMPDEQIQNIQLWLHSHLS